MADWNKRYAKAGAEGLFGDHPNVYVRQILARPDFDSRSALAIADGDGRNGRFLAQQGLTVTAVDLSETGTVQAVEKDARAGVKVERFVGDLAVWTVPDGRTFEAAFVVYLQCERTVRLRALSLGWGALSPGGWFVLEAFATDEAPPDGPARSASDRMGPDDANLLYTRAEVLEMLDGADLVEALVGDVLLEEGSRHTGLAHVIRVCARKPRA